MTIIAAKQIKNKWTLFTDDCVTIWQAQVSAAKKYRPKLRAINWKNCDLIIASCWATKDVDLVLNLIEAKLEIAKVKTTMDLGIAIQTVLIEAFKTLWELCKDPSVWLLILETNTNTLRHADDYSIFQLQDDAEIVAGSWEQAFLSAGKYENFLWALRLAVMSDEYCDFPIYAYRDWQMFSFYSYNNPSDMYETLIGNPPTYECAPGIYNEEYREPNWLTEVSSAKLWQNNRESD